MDEKIITIKEEAKAFSRNIKIKQIIKSYIILIIGLFIMGLGVSLSVISDLGTTPIATIPNVLKYSIPLSLGAITIIFNLILILIQFIILKSDFEKKQWIQIFVTVIFGYFINFGLYILSSIRPKNYFSKWLICIISCFIIAIGVYIEILSKAIILPGEGVSIAVCHVTNIEFGKMKTIFDTSNVIIGGILSLILYKNFQGIGLGTIFSGIVVGYIIRLYGKIFNEIFNNR